MPTQRISPDSDELLQNVAQGLLKARKVVVVTGAGISTNSGIPDFRSENGLYSLIQAQFDAAARRGPPSSRSESDKSDDPDDGAPPPKRRRVSPEPELPSEISEESEPVRDVIEVCEADTIIVRPKSNVSAESTSTSRRASRQNSVHLSNAGDTTPTLSTPQPKAKHPLSVPLLPTSPLSSPPPEGAPVSPEVIPSFDSTRLAGTPLPSSPLSSPPAVIFEPSAPSSPSDGSSDDQSSTSPSEVDETPPSSLNLFSSSQTSNSGRNSLPNMKGKDLFDAAIWADPLRTSVFYTFATTLRQKIKEVQPTSSHRFISHLRDRGKLVRCYTQNIDQIEEKVGLSTCLNDGPGSRGRFSRRSTANTTQLAKMVEEASNTPAEPPAERTAGSEGESSQQAASQPQEENATIKAEEDANTADAKSGASAMKRETSRSGVECVFLHGSLEQLRCFLCGRVCSWDDADREVETLSGQQPECPHCAGATAARQEKGKRALGVGKLRPDIVLYGEEHPNAHLISPIVTHDLALQPDMLLILGTSLRVHGLKVMVREFAKAVHNRGGKVVFVNFTKPPESSWGDVIDYWVEWDCDAWVANLQDRIPKLWQEPEPSKPKKKREAGGASDDNEKPETKKPPAAYPVALRDTKVVGAYWTLKIIAELHKITGTPPLVPPAPIARRASIATDTLSEASIEVAAKPSPLGKEKARVRRPRKSAPGALEKVKKPPSTLNPNHGRSRRKAEPSMPEETPQPPQSSPSLSQQRAPEPNNDSSILMSVKSNPRVRKPKVIYDGEPATPVARKRRGGAAATASAPSSTPAAEGNRSTKAELKLAPFKPQPASGPPSPYGKPEPLEPRPSQTVFTCDNEFAFRIEDMLRGLTTTTRNVVSEPQYQHHAPPALNTRSMANMQTVRTPVTPVRAAEESAAQALESLRNSSPIMTRTPQPHGGGSQGGLMAWGSSWITRSR